MSSAPTAIAFFEFENCGLEAMTSNLEATLGFSISGHLLEFYGRCANCLGSRAAD